MFEVVGPKTTILLDYRRFQGMCVLALRRRTWEPGQDPTMHRFEDVYVKKRVAAGEKAAARHLASLSSERFEQWAALIEHCALLQYDEGDPRKPGKFFVEVQGMGWKVTVKDPDTATQFSVVAPTIGSALDAASLLLACDDAPWEPDVWAIERTKKSKK